jgi:hypothetical protein
MEILPFISGIFSKVDNVAILILLVMNGAGLWLYNALRREEREDRKAILEIVNKNTEALNGVKLALELLRAKVET